MYPVAPSKRGGGGFQSTRLPATRYFVACPACCNCVTGNCHLLTSKPWGGRGEPANPHVSASNSQQSCSSRRLYHCVAALLLPANGLPSGGG